MTPAAPVITASPPERTELALVSRRERATGRVRAGARSRWWRSRDGHGRGQRNTGHAEEQEQHGGVKSIAAYGIEARPEIVGD